MLSKKQKNEKFIRLTISMLEIFYAEALEVEQ